MMVYAERTFHEWLEMTSWQRDDFCKRFMDHQKKMKEERERQESEIRDNSPRR